MSLFVNYDEEFVVDLTPEEYLESFNLEKLYFQNRHQDISNEETNPQPEKSEEKKEPQSDNLFFDYQYYNFKTPDETPRNTFKSSEKDSLNDEPLPFGAKKKNISPAWSNLNLNNSTDGNSPKDLVYSDNGHIAKKFRSTHVSYLEKRIAKMQKIQKEKEIENMEIDNENFTPSNEGTEVFYDEKIRRPLAGIHVDINEKYETDW